MTQGLVVVLSLLAVATGFGLFRHYFDGRIKRLAADNSDLTRTAPDLSHSGDLARRLGHPLGEVATFVQFSSAFCQPCRATRLLLDGIVSRIAGVAHVEVDAESHLDLVREMHVTRTPTTFILDKHGMVIGRAVGLPKRDDVLALLAPMSGSSGAL